MKRALLFLAGMAFAVSAVTAQGPLELVKATTERMLSALEANKQTIRDRPETIYDLVDEIVLPHFDFQTMARSVLGKHWRRASAQQRERFVEEFRTLLVRTYASSLAEYSGEDVVYLPVRGDLAGGEVTVRTEIQQQSGFPIPVDYRLERTDGEWKVTDVVIDNLDLVLNYRTSFAQEIGRLGLDRVIDNLAERNRQAAS